MIIEKYNDFVDSLKFYNIEVFERMGDCFNDKVVFILYNNNENIAHKLRGIILVRS